MKTLLPWTLGVVVGLVAGCGTGGDTTDVVALPAGDLVKGKQAFVELKCHACHTVAWEHQIPPPAETVKTPVLLGGDVTKKKTRGELATAIMDPSHTISVEVQKKWDAEAQLSPMGSFTHVMTVDQIIDVVTFLESRYRHVPSPYASVH